LGGDIIKTFIFPDNKVETCHPTNKPNQTKPNQTRKRQNTQRERNQIQAESDREANRSISVTPPAEKKYPRSKEEKKIQKHGQYTPESKETVIKKRTKKSSRPISFAFTTFTPKQLTIHAKAKEI